MPLNDDVTRTIQIAGYGRMSTDKQQLSPEVQENLITDWIGVQRKLDKWPKGAKWLGMLVDDAISSKVDLLDRPAGQHLLTILDRGDMIVVAKYNRAFRSAADCERTLDRLNEAGIRIVFLDLNIDTSTANGRMLAGILAVVSRHERDLRGDTTKDAMRELRRQHRPFTKPPPGWKTRELSGKGKVFTPDHEWRKVGIAARQMFRDGLSRNQVYAKFLPHYRKAGRDKPFSAQSLVHAAARACLGFPCLTNDDITEVLDVNTLRIDFILADEAYHRDAQEQLRPHIKTDFIYEGRSNGNATSND